MCPSAGRGGGAGLHKRCMAGDVPEGGRDVMVAKPVLGRLPKQQIARLYAR